mmetsp:Transcript_23114/g.58967  ORF Transcript_23114/g.58967 Transcript_23114/m.58967 type:complete len:571 (+) Transcript_23114:94-1806(+)
MSAPASAETNAEASTTRSSLNEWHTLVFGLPGAATTGFIYAYSSYSNALQESLGFSEGDKELIGIAASICNLITFTNGLILDRTSVRFCCIMGGLIMAVAYCTFGLVGLQVLPVGSSAVPLCFFLAFMGNYGASFMVASVFSVLAKNFDAQRRSQVVSVAKAWVGVSAGVGTTIFVGFFPSDEAASSRLGFLFFVAGVCGLVPLSISGVLKPIPKEERSLRPLAVPPAWRLPLCYVLTILLIATALASTISRQMGFAIALVIMLVSPFLLLLPHPEHAAAKGSQSAADDPITTATLIGVAEATATHGPSPLEGGPLVMMRTPEFYLLFASTFAIQSGGLFLTTNLGSMTEARSGPTIAAATCVTIFSCSQGLARLFTGLITDNLVGCGMPRTLYFAVLMALMAGAHALLCLSGPMALIAGTALGGVAFGSVYPLLVLSVAELFGRERVASNYMIFDGMPGAIGVFLIAKVLASAVYDAHVDQDSEGGSGSAGSAGKCVGDECFRLAHMVIVVIELSGVVLGIILAFRTRSIYRTLAPPRAASSSRTTEVTPAQAQVRVLEDPINHQGVRE